MLGWRLPLSAAPGPLFLTSLTFVLEELGVATLELFGERDSAPTSVELCEDGDAVPEAESFFFEDLDSLPRVNCSCW